MITVTKKEHEDKVSSSLSVVKIRAWDCLCDLERGASIRDVYKSLSVSHCHLEAIRNYKTGEFQPEEHFNVLSPESETSIYSNINTIK